MISSKKLRYTIATMTAGAALLIGPATASAAEWNPRTASDIESEIVVNDDGTKTYTIQWGDTLSAIAQATGISVNSLTEANGIHNADLIYPSNNLTVSKDNSVVTFNDTASGEESSYNVSSDQATEVESSAETETQSAEESAPAEQPAEQTQSYTGTSSSAKEWIAQKESGGSYDARNGIYIGRYQLTNSYLNGDYSPENQERVADQYVANRYGSWEAAKSFWLANGWY